MQRIIPVFCLLALIAGCTPPVKTIPNTLVKTESGWVQGAHNKDSTVAIYKGIPFAAPPVGDLRWKEPQPVKPWTDTLSCKKFSASPVQNPPVPFLMWSKEFIAPPEPLSEDCLYLNIWSPVSPPGTKLPVLVWIYGGGFVSGSAACDVYDGEELAKQGILFVSINYRVGIFGFFAHPGLSAESAHKVSGNYGLMDQVAALQWIQKNISSFGGDPSHVTIAGQSAGSMAVQSVVATPLSKGLFSGAIAQSGGLTGRPIKSLKEAEQSGTTLNKKIHADGIDVLRNLSADSVLSLGKILPWGSYTPVFDGYFFPESPQAIFANHHQNDVPVLVGWVTGDATLVSQEAKTKDQFIKFVQDNYKDQKDTFLRLFPADDDKTAIESQHKLGLLQFAGVPAYQWALSNKSKTYLYEYSYVPTDKPGFPNYGAFHTSEVPFALHTLDRWDRPWVPADRQVETYMSRFWVNFTKTGDPNAGGPIEWPAYEANASSIIEMDKVTIVKNGLYKEELELLSK